MSFYGKVYKSEKQDNVEEFFKAIGTPEAQAQAMIKADATLKISKNGDNYTLELTGARNLNSTFKNGGECVDKINDKLILTSTFTVDGNVITQTQKGTDGRLVTIRREFRDDTATEKITAAGWDGVAYRYFKA